MNNEFESDSEIEESGSEMEESYVELATENIYGLVERIRNQDTNITEIKMHNLSEVDGLTKQDEINLLYSALNENLNIASQIQKLIISDSMLIQEPLRDISPPQSMSQLILFQLNCQDCNLVKFENLPSLETIIMDNNVIPLNFKIDNCPNIKNVSISFVNFNSSNLYEIVKLASLQHLTDAHIDICKKSENDFNVGVAELNILKAVCAHSNNFKITFMDIDSDPVIEKAVDEFQPVKLTHHALNTFFGDFLIKDFELQKNNNADYEEFDAEDNELQLENLIEDFDLEDKNVELINFIKKLKFNMHVSTEEKTEIMAYCETKDAQVKDFIEHLKIMMENDFANYPNYFEFQYLTNNVRALLARTSLQPQFNIRRNPRSPHQPPANNNTSPKEEEEGVKATNSSHPKRLRPM